MMLAHTSYIQTSSRQDKVSTPPVRQHLHSNHPCRVSKLLRQQDSHFQLDKVSSMETHTNIQTMIRWDKLSTSPFLSHLHSNHFCILRIILRQQGSLYQLDKVSRILKNTQMQMMIRWDTLSTLPILSHFHSYHCCSVGILLRQWYSPYQLDKVSRM